MPRICFQFPAIGVNANEAVEDLTFGLDLFVIQAYTVRLYLEGLFQLPVSNYGVDLLWMYSYSHLHE